MIKGNGYLKNYEDLKKDIDLVNTYHPSIKKTFPHIFRIHNNYSSIYQKCPISKNVNYSNLPQKYSDIWETLYDLYFDIRASNFCCYCGKNEPDRLDHFHPSSKIPQYSILRFNLIRSCVKCNEIKLARYPISVLKLKHPYFDKSYNKHEILFDVLLKDICKNNEGDVFFDIDVVPNSALSRAAQKDVEFTLDTLGIKRRVGHRVALELENVFSQWSTYKGTPAQRKSEFEIRAKYELKNKNYREYFCFNILSSVRTINKLDQF